MSRLFDALNSATENPIKKYESFVRQQTRDKRLLTSATLELSPICNFICPFCYVRKTPQQLLEQGEKIMRFDDWRSIIDGLAQMKVVYLTFTGGECMLHPDFAQLYRYAYEKDFLISMLSNGSCLTDEILSTLKQCPPQELYITMYGGSPKTYEQVCGSAVYYDKVMQNAKKIKEAGIDLVLQCTVSKDNVEDFEQIGKVAKMLNVPFRYSMDFVSCRRCDSEMIEANAADEEKFAEIIWNLTDNPIKPSQIQPPYSVTLDKNPNYGKGMSCGAGRSACSFNYKGQMIPCVTFDAIKIDTIGRSIADCWKELVAACDEVPSLEECATCIHSRRCRLCQAYHYYDLGEFGKPSPRLCFKRKYPERAKEIEEHYAQNGCLRSDLGDLD